MHEGQRALEVLELVKSRLDDETVVVKGGVSGLEVAGRKGTKGWLSFSLLPFLL